MGIIKVYLEMHDRDYEYNSPFDSQEFEVIFVNEEYVDKIQDVFDAYDHYWMNVYNEMNLDEIQSVEDLEEALEENGEEIDELEKEHYDAFREIGSWSLGELCCLFERIYPDAIPKGKIDVKDCGTAEFNFTW